MPTFEEHCRDTERRLGNRFEDVHRWLDELAPTLGPDHRKIRHNADGVAHCFRKWGEKAAVAAQCHIDLDEKSHIKVGPLWVPKPLGEVNQFNLPKEAYPLTLRLLRFDNREVVWEKVIDLPNDGPVAINIPPAAKECGVPVIAQVIKSDGTIISEK